MVGEGLETILSSMISAAVYSIMFYAKKRANNVGESFEPKKLLATVIVGLIIGIFYGYYGLPLDKPTITEQLVTYTGTIALVESSLKWVYRTANENISLSDSDC